ncbi:hypothetical protein [Sediminicoccus rosea]|uniref:Uncharacterized protein n=1 Tax=Sediminicoccus rosea TaxID=1225128 RepID=A0ABZ0PKZ0_9PROT|nr:hypothetical protein [Sediminicoccus rosea]WPB86364.1 hypothetical protein R9Z33_05700 [Sediminicoccus rosea]
MESDFARLDWDALIGWAMTAVPMLLFVGIIWYRRWRRDPKAFLERLGTTTPGTTIPGSSTFTQPKGRL